MGNCVERTEFLISRHIVNNIHMEYSSECLPTVYGVRPSSTKLESQNRCSCTFFLYLTPMSAKYKLMPLYCFQRQCHFIATELFSSDENLQKQETRCLSSRIKTKASLKMIFWKRLEYTIWKEHPTKGWTLLIQIYLDVLHGQKKRFRLSGHNHHRWKHGGGRGSQLFTRGKPGTHDTPRKIREKQWISRSSVKNNLLRAPKDA